MAINWGTQQPIQPPSVVAQLPQQANGMDQFAGGLLSGIAQGQQIQSNNIALGQQRQQVQDEQALREAAGQGEDKWMSTLISQGKVAEAKQYQATQLQYQNALLANKASVLELNDKQAAKADRDNSINVAVMGAVSQLPPEQREDTYLKYKTDMEKQYPGIHMPEKFSADSMASVMRTNEIIQQTQTLKMTDDVATLNTLQKQRDALLLQKQQSMKTGKPTESIDQSLKEIQSMINTRTKNVQTQTTEGMVDKGLLEMDIGDVKESRDKSADAASAIEQFETFKKLNEQFKTGMFAETKLNVQKAYETLTGQKLNSTKFGEAMMSKGMDFVFKRIQDTKGAISDKEMELFKAASAGMANSKEGNAVIMDIAIAVEKRKIEYAEDKRSYLQEHGSLKGFQSEWAKKIEANPIITDNMMNRVKGSKGKASPMDDPLGLF